MNVVRAICFILFYIGHTLEVWSGLTVCKMQIKTCKKCSFGFVEWILFFSLCFLQTDKVAALAVEFNSIIINEMCSLRLIYIENYT